VRPTVRLLPAALLLAALAPAGAAAWPAEAVVAITRDARRLLPRSLNTLLGERESLVKDELARFPPELSRMVAADLPSGRLSPPTVAALQGEVDRVVAMLHEGRVSEGIVRMGGLARIPADLADPVLAVGPEGWPPGLVREYYALFTANLGRMPVVLEDRATLDTPRQQLPVLWQALVDRSREQVPTLRAEMFRDGRVVSASRLDYRSPAWAVSSIAYSRAVAGVAATWLAAWRDANGDLTNIPRIRVAAPRDAPAPAADGRRPPPPEAP
jgi:hypothetical protein